MSSRPNVMKGKGSAYLWLMDHVAHADQQSCLRWPFSTNGTGYGRIGYEGHVYYAHRFMCERAHGPAPTSSHEAAHSCGNGTGGCVNPKHLSWKTPSENQLDRRRHGTHVTSTYGSRGKLSSADKMEILSLRGMMPQRAIAAKSGVHFETISRVLRTDPNKKLKIHGWWPAEDDILRNSISNGETLAQIALKMGRSSGSIKSRAYKLKIPSVPSH